MASRIVANDNRLAEIGDRLTARERRILDVYRSLNDFDKALMRQEFARIVRLPGEH